MEFVKLKYANNKLINADIKEHRDVINEYVEKKGYEYVGFIPILFGPSGKTLEVDLIFRKPSCHCGCDKECCKAESKAKSDKK